jgi:hypothetical protein
MSRRDKRPAPGKAGPEPRSLAFRMGTHFTIAAAIIVTDFGVAMMVVSEGLDWIGVAWLVLHAVVIGVVVLLWLPLSAWLAGRVRLPEAAAEGLMVLLLGLLVAAVEFGLFRGAASAAHTIVAAVGLLAGWAMRIPPPQPEQSSKGK